MLQKLGDHIANCLARADDAVQRGLQTADLETKAEAERMAKAWRHLARSCEFVESLERFLLDGHAVNNALPSTRPSCPKCGKNMRLLGIEAAGDQSDLFTFECTDCGHLEAVGAPAA
jgi:predicted  nucleic acid-binding Zn ribbon protein